MYFALGQHNSFESAEILCFYEVIANSSCTSLTLFQVFACCKTRAKDASLSPIEQIYKRKKYRYFIAGFI